MNSRRTRPDDGETCFHSGEVLSGDRGRGPRMRGEQDGGGQVVRAGLAADQAVAEAGPCVRIDSSQPISLAFMVGPAHAVGKDSPDIGAILRPAPQAGPVLGWPWIDRQPPWRIRSRASA
jgi:hypothetical protein